MTIYEDFGMWELYKWQNTLVDIAVIKKQYNTIQYDTTLLI